MKLVYKVLITALALLAVAYLVPGVSVDSIYIAIVTAIILGLFNLVVRPILVVLTLPITIITLGLFMFVINAGIFLFIASFVDGFDVNGFWAALLGSLLVSLISAVGHKIVS